MSTSKDYHIRLIDRLFISRINIKSDSIVNFPDVFDEYIIHKDMKNIFQEHQLMGVEFIHLYKMNEIDIHQDCYQIYSSSILPPAQIDKAFNYEMRSGDLHWRIQIASAPLALFQKTSWGD